MINIRFHFILFLIGLGSQIFPQSSTVEIEGNVSYITSSSVYVRFSDAEKIQIGDTLSLLRDNQQTPALIVDNKSSISVVCTPLAGITVYEGEAVVYLPPAIVAPEVQPQVEAEKTNISEDNTVVSDTAVEKEKNDLRKQKISGRLSVSSYTNWSNAKPDIGQRMRYTFSFNGMNLGQSKFSFETYISYVQQLDAWKESQGSIFDGLKIYNFSGKYDISNTTRIWFGRKINYKLTSLGAIDGVQFEHMFRTLTLGLVAGTRPNYEDYSFDPSLFQYGIYLSHNFSKGVGKMETTIAFMNQTNNWNTDRRFLYFQHTNMLLKPLFFMATVEVDLYSVVDSLPTNTFNLSNIYLQLRYKILKNLSLTASYSARQNIILYETNKDYLERLLETGTLQGFRVMINYRPLKNLSLGLKGGYRYRVDDPRPTEDVYGYLNYSLIPGINASATLSATWLKTAYLQGWVYSLGLSRDFFKGKIYAGAHYRYINYNFTISDVPSVQNVVELNLNYRIYRKLSLGAYYETAFESENTFNRFYINLTQRF